MGKHLPKGWKRLRLGDVCEINPRADSLKGVKNVSFVAMADVSESGKLTNQSLLPASKKSVAGYTRFRRGDILCAKITPCFENGKGAFVSDLDTEQGIGSTEFHVLRPSDEILSELVHAIVHSTEFRRRGELWMTGSAGQRRVPSDYINEYLVDLPPIDEQRRIAAVLDESEACVTINNTLLLRSSRLLNALREHVLIHPDQAKLTSLGAVTTESMGRNLNTVGRESVMAVTKEFGLRPMREGTIAPDISRYKVVRPDAFAYNPMRINIGSIGLCLSQRAVLVSPDYVVFECDESRLLPAYLDHLRHTRIWSSYFERAGNGGVRVRIYYDDLAQFKVNLPPIAEQKRIVRLLNAVQRDVELLDQTDGALKQQKRGLMQKLLTGEWRLNRDLPDTEAVDVGA